MGKSWDIEVKKKNEMCVDFLCKIMYNIFVKLNDMLAYFQINFMKGLFEVSDFVCHNCGECCGPVAIREEERRRIEGFLKKHPSVRERIKHKTPSLDCVFRDDEKGCLIYPCRPQICKAYTCSSKHWTKDLKKPSGSLKLINECFGAACSKEDFEVMLDNFFAAKNKKT